MTHEGRCHCGNLRVTFETEQQADRLPVRVCGCTFCVRHGARWVTDPIGALEVRIGAPDRVSRYRFGLETSEFLICSICGVHVAAVATIGRGTYGALNCNVLEDRGAFTSPPRAVDYDGETAATRIERRRQSWTPTVVGRR